MHVSIDAHFAGLKVDHGKQYLENRSQGVAHFHHPGNGSNDGLISSACDTAGPLRDDEHSSLHTKTDEAVT